MKWKVTKIIDGDTFEVYPNWKWRGQSGNRVRPVGYNAPEVGTSGSTAATSQLSKLILWKEVELDPKTIDRGRLVAIVYLEGVDIARYFPAYR